jgi:ATP-binding cassette subfamily F protein 3
VLSGGEKARVALAKVIAAKGNFLMLDEPTNHLDMQSVEMLIEALNKYKGTLILVSHDRYFISKTANKIWNIENGKINEFVGDYEEWVQWEADKDKREERYGVNKNQQMQIAERKEEKINVVKEPIAKPTQQQNNEYKKQHQQKTKQFQKAETELENLKATLATVETQLADPATYADKAKFQTLDEQYKKLTTDVNQKAKEYEKLFEEMMELEEKMNG